MQKLRYQEAKNWFWTRTWFWLLPAAIASVILCYFLPEQVFGGPLVKSERLMRIIAGGMGVGAVMFGLMAASVSLQTPWMRYGWRIAFILNCVLCAVIACVAALLLGGVVLSFIQNDPQKIPSEQTLNAAMSLIQFGAGAGVLWGMIFGTWFAARRDKYFVEPN